MSIIVNTLSDMETTQGRVAAENVNKTALYLRAEEFETQK